MLFLNYRVGLFLLIRISFRITRNTAKDFSLYLCYSKEKEFKKKAKEGDFSVYSANHLN